MNSCTLGHPNQERNKGASLDVPGSLVAVGGLASIVFGLSEASIKGWGDGLTIGLLVAGAALLGLFVLVESKVRRPFVPLYVRSSESRGIELCLAFKLVDPLIMANLPKGVGEAGIVAIVGCEVRLEGLGFPVGFSSTRCVLCSAWSSKSAFRR